MAEHKERPDPRNQVLDVKVFSPYQVFYHGPAKSVSAINSTGPFDVLSGHINFFSVLMEGNVIVKTDEEPREIPVAHGIIHVRSNKVTLFVFGLSTDEDEEEGAPDGDQTSAP